MANTVSSNSTNNTYKSIFTVIGCIVALLAFAYKLDYGFDQKFEILRDENRVIQAQLNQLQIRFDYSIEQQRYGTSDRWSASMQERWSYLAHQHLDDPANFPWPDVRDIQKSVPLGTPLP